MLCVDEAYQEERLDLGSGPARVQFNRSHQSRRAFCKANQAFWGRGGELKGLGPHSARGKRLLGSRKIDAVLITGSPYYPMLLAEPIKRRFAVPVVLDFQDPWVSDAGAKQPKSSKPRPISSSRYSPRAACVARGGLHHIGIRGRQNADMAARYPWLDRAQMASLPIGGNSDDFAALREQPLNQHTDDLLPGVVNLSFVGTFMPRSVPPVRALFRGFRQLLMSNPIVATRIRLNFFGTSNQPSERATNSVMSIA